VGVIEYSTPPKFIAWALMFCRSEVRRLECYVRSLNRGLLG
jgi:hypothetical protein